MAAGDTREGRRGSEQLWSLPEECSRSGREWSRATRSSGGLGLPLLPPSALLRRWQWVVETGCGGISSGDSPGIPPPFFPPSPRWEAKADLMPRLRCSSPSSWACLRGGRGGGHGQCSLFIADQTKALRGQRAHSFEQGMSNSCPCSRVQLKERHPQEAAPVPPAALVSLGTGQHSH